MHDRLEGRIQKTRIAQVLEARGGGGEAATLPLGGIRQTVQAHIVRSRAASTIRVSRRLMQRAPRSGIRVVLIIRTGTSQAVPKGVGGLRGFSYQSWLLRAKGQCGWGHLQINCTLIVQNRQAKLIGRIRV